MEEERLKDILRRMGEKVPGLEGAMVVDEDGLVVARWGVIPQEELMGGVIAALVGMAKRSLDQLGTGKRDWMAIHGTKKKVFLWEVDPKATLVAIASPEATTGLVLTVAQGAIKEIKGAI